MERKIGMKPLTRMYSHARGRNGQQSPSGCAENAGAKNDPPDNPNVGFVTVAQYARYYAVDRRTVRNWIKAKKIPAQRIGRMLRIPRSALKHGPKK